MLEVLRQLVELTEVDDEIASKEAKLAASRARVPNATKARDVAKQALEDAKAEQKSFLEAQRAKEREEEQYQTRLSRAQRALETGVGDADAAERQRVQCLEILDGLETDLLEMMETAEAHEATVAGRTQELADREADIGTEAEAAAPESAALERELTVLRGRRDGLREVIHDIEVKRYDALRGRKKRPVSPLVNGRDCKACNRVVVANTLTELRAGRLVGCGGCGRWLYMPGMLEEAS